MGKRRIIIITAAVILLLLAGIVTILWSGLDWPPPRLILKYGFPPTGGPTGNVRVIEGVEFVELKPGYFRMGSHYRCDTGDLLGRVCRPLGLPWGRESSHDTLTPPRWVEFTEPLWVARSGHVEPFGLRRPSYDGDQLVALLRLNAQATARVGLRH